MSQLREIFIEDTIHISKIDIMRYRNESEYKFELKVRIYWKIQTLATKPLRKALQGMKE
jgi:hypothetical protein